MKILIKTQVYERWLQRLKDAEARATILEKVYRLQQDLSIDTRSVGGGVQEIRVFVGKGYRIYFTQEDNKIVILLSGGNKDTQSRDIARAKELLKEWRNSHGK